MLGTYAAKSGGFQPRRGSRVENPQRPYHPNLGLHNQEGAGTKGNYVYLLPAPFLPIPRYSSNDISDRSQSIVSFRGPCYRPLFFVNRYYNRQLC